MSKLDGIKDFALMSIGCILMAVGIYFFKIPNGFATGGVSGMGTVLGKITPITSGAWIWILNITMLLLGFIFLGRNNGIKTVYCSMLYSIIIYVLEILVPIDSPITNQPLMELVYAMLLTSIGSAMIFYSNASSGGTDILALILKKYVRIDVGKALLVVDFFVALSSIFIFNITTGLFSLLGLFAKAFIVDAVIDNLNTCKYFIVITEKAEQVSEYIMQTLHHGVTSHTVTGEYTKENKVMIHTVCKRIEAIRLRNEIKKIDPKAFTVITTSNEVIGRGFRSV